MGRHLWLKLIGVSAFTGVFFIGYFHLLRHPAYPVTPMPLTPLDHLIAFQPSALAVYASLWLYIGIAPGLLLTRRDLIVYALRAAALCLSGFACFYFWPTAVPPLGIDVALYPSFAVLQAVDASGNACPSLHVATAMFSATWIDRLLRDMKAPSAPRLFNALWFVAIVYSTLAVKQHVALDVIGGLLLALPFALRSVRGVDPPA